MDKFPLAKATESFAILLFFALSVPSASLADTSTPVMGGQVSVSLAFASETALIDHCQLIVTNLDQSPYTTADRPAKVTLVDANGVSDSIVIKVQDPFTIQDLASPQGSILHIVNSTDGRLAYQRTSDLIYVQVGSVQCGQKID